MEPYPKNIDPELDSLTEALRVISRYREQDITDRNNFPAIFLLGRKVGKIPASSLDVAVTDRVGDLNYDNNFLYLFVPAAEWRRIALSSW